MSPLARPKLFRDDVRCAVTQTGTLLAAPLVFVPIRLSLGARSNVDHLREEKSTASRLKGPEAPAKCPYIGMSLVTTLGHVPK